MMKPTTKTTVPHTNSFLTADVDIKDGWVLRVTEFTCLSGDEFGTRYLARGVLRRGEKSVRVSGFAHKTQLDAIQGLADLACTDVDHINW